MIKIGLVVNPVAGMGGLVGLKGTDGEMSRRAAELGAEPVTPVKIREVLALVRRKDIFFISAPGKMGEDYLKSFDFKYKVIGEIGEETASGDTKRLAKAMAEEGIGLLVFVGGDGTARDILDAVGTKIPVVAVPSGVKMFSSVFALSTHAAAEMINTFGDRFTEKEVLDIDEDAFRENRLVSKYYGIVRVPDIQGLLQGEKASSNVQVQEKDKKQEVARYIVEKMDRDTMYILGPGTTLKAITDLLAVDKTLLGIDAVLGGRLIGQDLNEAGILNLIRKHPKTKIIVTPIGGNGFIFGRGSLQISAAVLQQTGKENIIVVSTLDKAGALESLRVDSGNEAVDKMLSGKIDVVIGYDEKMVMEVKF